MLWYGPGFIRSRGASDRPVSLADVAPTQAELLGFHLPDAEGAALEEILVPRAERSEPPRLIVTLVWDAAGGNVLREWPDAWPNLRGLIPQGAWFGRANIGSSPPSTAQIHATIGTGVFPRTHGITAHRMRVGGGPLVTPWKPGPNLLLRPTLADLYDRARRNRPLVGTIGSGPVHLGMMSHGAMWGGGDRDVAALRVDQSAETLGAEAHRWQLDPTTAPWYRHLEYLNDLPPLSDYLPEVDRSDGRSDGRWHGHTMEELDEGAYSPARVPFQTRAVREVIEREGFGVDEVTDLLFLNYKLLDEIGHRFSMNGVEMRDSLLAQDADLPRLIRLLDETVGRGRWVMVLTADHGHTPDPAVTGHFMISPVKVGGAVLDRFDRDGDDRRLVDKTLPTQLFIDTAELRDNGHTLEEVSAFVLSLTKARVAAEGIAYAPSEARDRVFAAVLPSAMLDELPCLRDG